MSDERLHSLCTIEIPWHLQELQEQVRAADQAKIVAQREMHEMQIEMRKRAGMMQQPAVHAQVDAEGIQAIIQEMESQGIGVPFSLLLSRMSSGCGSWPAYMPCKGLASLKLTCTMAFTRQSIYAPV